MEQDALETDTWAIATLLGASFIASVISTALGVGGSLLLASMATVLPGPLVIPIHACVSFFGNVNRWAILHKYVDYKVFFKFAIGAAIGVGCAAPIVALIPNISWELLLGSFLIIATWWKPKGLKAGSDHYPWQCGVVASFLAMFVGGIKPILVTFFSQRFSEHRAVVATTNACGTVPQLGKIAVFAAVGSAFLDYWMLILGLIATGVAGAYVGRYLLISSFVDVLRKLLKIFITCLGINLLATGFGVYPWN